MLNAVLWLVHSAFVWENNQIDILLTKVFIADFVNGEMIVF